MSDSVMYPEAGRWVNSYLVGANAYKIMSTPEEAQQLLLDVAAGIRRAGADSDGTNPAGGLFLAVRSGPER